MILNNLFSIWIQLHLKLNDNLLLLYRLRLFNFIILSTYCTSYLCWSNTKQLNQKILISLSFSHPCHKSTVSIVCDSLRLRSLSVYQFTVILDSVLTARMDGCHAGHRVQSENVILFYPHAYWFYHQHRFC